MDGDLPEAEGSGRATGAALCPPCGAELNPLRARHHAVREGRIVAYCSPDCRDRAAQATFTRGEVTGEVRRASPHPWRQWAAVSAVVIGGGLLLGIRVRVENVAATAALPTSKQAVAADPPPPEEFGPTLPPAEFFIEGERWYHPLGGPVRRLPERPTRRFGAGRDHDSPDSCRQGHCGVDVGEVRGEPVLAVHDGFVERAVREIGEDRGGRYVRLLHDGGRVITQYMHLDEVAQHLKPGIHVRAGEVLGTVGESGIKNAGPHLHFTVATRTSENAPESYVDPEPLLSLWPLFPR